MMSSDFLLFNSSRTEENYLHEKEKCQQAESAAWAAKPKVYRLIRKSQNTATPKQAHKMYQLKQKRPDDPVVQVTPTFHQDIKALQFEYVAQDKPNNQVHHSAATRFFALGCQGDKDTSQQFQVAELMNKMASPLQGAAPDFVLLLGDNFYDFGVEGPTSKQFTTNFEAIYTNTNLAYLRKIPCFAILGNHDENIHKKAFMEPEKGIERGMHQVAHTYLATEFKTTADLQNLFQSHTTTDAIIDLDVNELPAWNMPSRTYALISGNTQIFCIDSNKYVSDFLKLCAGDKNPDNQAAWVKKEYDKAIHEGRNVLLALHHPLITPGKRAFHSDHHLYLSDEERYSEEFKKYFGHLVSSGSEPSYNQLMRETCKHQQLVFHAVLTAHDHDLYNYNNKNEISDYPLCQMTSGGGGGPLQERESFEDQKSMGCFIKRHGFTDVYSQGDGLIHFYLNTIRKTNQELDISLHFTNKDCKPLRVYPQKMATNEIEGIEKICSVTKSAVDEYFAFISSRQNEKNGSFLGITPWSGNMKHGYDGVERAHKIWAYISHQIADDLFSTMETIFMLSRPDTRYTTPSKHSFITILNNKIEAQYGSGMTIELLYNNLKENTFLYKIT